MKMKILLLNLKNENCFVDENESSFEVENEFEFEFLGSDVENENIFFIIGNCDVLDNLAGKIFWRQIRTRAKILYNQFFLL